MKKLMIAAAVLATAYLSQAASMKWNYAATSADVDQHVYLILGSTPSAEWANEAAVAAAALEGGYGAVAKHSKKYYAEGAASGEFDYDASFYAVLVSADGKQWATTAAFTPGETYISVGQDPAKDPYGFTAASFGAFQDWNSGPGPTPVPEPPSGLLLLLGVAGLALRRRRA